LAYLDARNYRQAIDDFDRALDLKRDLVDGYLSRGIAYRGLRKFPEGIADVTKALEDKSCPTKAYFIRADMRRELGDKAGAEEDEARGLRETPTDPLSWAARGFAIRARDPHAALAAFNKALDLDPRCYFALQNKAAVLAEAFKKDDESLDIMNFAVRLYPDSVLTRGGRGVLLARKGKRKEALDDAQAALLLDSEAPTLYQVACIYSLTSKQVPADQLKAMSFLAGALRKGFALGWIDTDPDMDPLRKLPEFDKAVAAARELAKKSQTP
jgi:tetratricopeptide (TPR) repeat protein